MLKKGNMGILRVMILINWCFCLLVKILRPFSTFMRTVVQKKQIVMYHLKKTQIFERLDVRDVFTITILLENIAVKLNSLFEDNV